VNRIPPAIISLVIFLTATALVLARDTRVKPGYVVHFDFIVNEAEGRNLVALAQNAGAKVINVVPPAHVWESPAARGMLDAIIDEIDRRHLSFVMTRIDAAYPPNAKGERYYYLYDKILNRRGTMPDGNPTNSYFLATVGKDGYAEWMEEETRYYARHYGGSHNLLGINLGPFSEPFSSERGGFLDHMKETNLYEITQYTPFAVREWHRWLERKFGKVETLNSEYGTSFPSIEVVPMPLNENDPRFARADVAYFDFSRMLNDWLVDRYQSCRRIWHREGGRVNVPFILQFDGGMAEKMALGRAAFAAFDLPAWIDMADALGLSVYTNSGFLDFGHASIEATVNLASITRDLRKPVFVLEGGCEAPNVVLDSRELEFYGTVARRLNPRTYIYEFLKEKWNEPYASNPGKLMGAGGKVQEPAFEALRNLFASIESSKVPSPVPALYVVSTSESARRDRRVGVLIAALYDVASSVPIWFVPKGRESVMRSGVPVLNPDGSVRPPNEGLSRLLTEIPPAGSDARKKWTAAVAAAVRQAKSRRPAR
jgi:hypothetical protein